MNAFIWAGLAIVIAAVVATVVSRRRAGQSADTPVPVAQRASLVTMSGEATSPAPAQVQEEEDTVAILLGPSAAEPVVSISEFPGKLPKGSRPIAAEGTTLSQLGPVLQAVPSLLTSREVARGGYMKVIIDGPLVKAADGEGYRAFTMGAKGIKQQARLLDPSRLSKMVNAAAILNIASLVVAQKHLADITKKLDDIKQGVDRIEAFLRDERKSSILGALDYLRQVAQALFQGELSPAVRQKLEDYEGQLLATERHLKSELTRETQGIEAIKDPDTFRTNGFVTKIREHQALLDGLHEQWLLCVRARVAGWQLLSAFPGEPHMKQARLDSLEDSVESLVRVGGLLDEAKRLMEAKIETVQSRLERESTLTEKRTNLRKWVQNELVAVAAAVRAQSQGLAAGEAMLLEQQKPTVLAVKLDAGRIVEAHHVPA
ncbi:hypothetical protein [Cupriavidus basilensis]|uniref:Uncharacterized protein n=1 Tax=Cupriavidus basilensis TaxID=68895 RepID=A0A643FXB0_9BURK|nr:hypothetical protein [Cupriavidus basilensis]QOT76583.1 hypothetical protein F7R26_000245 [Cupriavidus basilensis]